MGTTFLSSFVQGSVERDRYLGSGHMWDWCVYVRSIFGKKGHCFWAGKGLCNLLPLPWMRHFHPSSDGYMWCFLKAKI